MVQVLEGVPSFGSRLGAGLGQALGEFGGGAAQGYFQGKSQQRQAKQFADAFKQMSGMDISGLPPQAQQEFVKQFAKQQSQMQMLAQMAPELFGGQTNQGEEMQKGGSTGVPSSRGYSRTTPEQRLKISTVNPALAKAMSREEDLSFRQSEALKAEESQSKENKYVKENYGMNLDDIKDPNLRKSLITEAIKETGHKKEREQAIKDIKITTDWLDKNIKFSGKFGVSPKWGGIEAQGESRNLALMNPETGKPLSNLEINEIREGINTSGFLLADKVYTHFNVGVINKPKWEDIKHTFAPHADQPASINRARMASLKRIMALPPDSSPEVVDKKIDAEKKSLEKIEKAKGVKQESKGKKLTTAVLDQFLSQANDDPEEASRLAKEAGYTW